MIDIPQIQLHTLGHLLNGPGFAAQSVDLRPASNPRLDVVAKTVIGNVSLVFPIMGDRMRSDRKSVV